MHIEAVAFLVTVQEKIDILNDKFERECYGSGERSLPPGDLTDYPETKNLSKQKCKTYFDITYRSKLQFVYYVIKKKDSLEYLPLKGLLQVYNGNH